MSIVYNYLGYGAAADRVLRFHAVVIALYQVVRALAHEVEALAVEGGVVRIADGRAPGRAVALGTGPAAPGADAAVAVTSHLGARLEGPTAQPTGALFGCQAAALVQQASHGTEAAFLAGLTVDVGREGLAAATAGLGAGPAGSVDCAVVALHRCGSRFSCELWVFTQCI